MADIVRLRTPHEEHRAGAPPIEAVDLTVAYGDTVALDSVNFCLQSGHRVAVVGPNGAGKTTLFKVIAGILEPDAGQIVVHGHKPGQHLCVGYVPQRSEVDWRFPVTVGDVVMMGRIREIGLFGWPRRSDWERVGQALDEVGMETYASRQIGELSGGQQQRVFLAQVAAQEAEVVLLDEPLAGLDVPSQEAILEILDRLREAGVTVVVATHDLKLAAEYFDEVLLLNRHLVSMGPAAAALKREALIEAYGSGVHLMEAEEGLTVLADSHLGGT